MRDLYNTLGVPRTANKPEILKALSRVRNERLKQEISHILLTDQRRRVYDRSHRILSDIGQLRANLGTSTCCILVAGSLCRYFNRDPDPAGTFLDRLSGKKTAAKKNPSSTKTQDLQGINAIDDLAGATSRKMDTSRVAGPRFSVYSLVFITGFILFLGAVDVNNNAPSYTGVPPSSSTESTGRSGTSSTYRGQGATSTLPPVSTPRPVFSAPAQPLPANGWGITYHSGQGVAPARNTKHVGMRITIM